MQVITKRNYDPSVGRKTFTGKSETKPNPNSLTIGQLFRNYAGGTEGIEMAPIYLNPKDFDQDHPDLNKMTRLEIAQYQLKLQDKLRTVTAAELQIQKAKIADRTAEEITAKRKLEKKAEIAPDTDLKD